MAPLLKIFHMAVSSPLGGRYSPMEKNEHALNFQLWEKKLQQSSQTTLY